MPSKPLSFWESLSWMHVHLRRKHHRVSWTTCRVLRLPFGHPIRWKQFVCRFAVATIDRQVNDTNGLGLNTACMRSDSHMKEVFRLQDAFRFPRKFVVEDVNQFHFPSWLCGCGFKTKISQYPQFWECMP